MTRREVIQSLAASLPASAWMAKAHAAETQPFAGWITLAATIGDVRRLAQFSSAANKTTVTAIQKFPELTNLGASLAQAGPDGLRINVGDALVGPDLQIAVQSGAMIAKAAQAAWQTAATLDHDAAVLRERGPGGNASYGEIRQYLDAMDIRCQIELHTLDPEERDIHAWLESIARWHRKSQEYLDALARAITSPAKSSFLSPGDPFVSAAGSVRRAEAISGDDLMAKSPTSPYGAGLKAGLEALRQIAAA